MSKRKRQEAILSIIAKHPVSTQEELVERLQRAGIATTQATVSQTGGGSSQMAYEAPRRPSFWCEA